jgi:hypothetical protein
MIAKFIVKQNEKKLNKRSGNQDKLATWSAQDED